MKATFSPDPLRISTRILRICLSVVMLFFIADYVLNASTLQPNSSIKKINNIAREDSLSSFVASTQTMIIGLGCWWMYLAHKNNKTSETKGWKITAMLFTIMALDDGAVLHERIATAIGKGVEANPDNPVNSLMTIFPSYNWHLFVLPLFIVLGLFSFRFLSKSLTHPRKYTMLAASIALICLALGLDYIEGFDEEDLNNPYHQINNALSYEQLSQTWFNRSQYKFIEHTSKAIEEASEMAAMSFILSLIIFQVLSQPLSISPKKHN